MRHTLVAAALLLAAVSTTGCRIDEDKHGDNKDVKITTPFGGMQVKTDNADVLAGLGLPAYPGAVAVKEKHDGGDKDGEGSADVNFSFGSFQLKVKAAAYRTPDSPEKVTAFYRKALGRYGNVIQCNGKKPVGSLTHTSEGLTCDEDSHDTGDNDVHISGNDLKINGAGNDNDSKYQFKAGSKKHQHIVDINPEGSGTKFNLVSLDLPTDFHFGSDDKNNKNDKEQ